MLDAFSLPFVQRGLLEIAILSVPAGLLGSWIVLRGLAFFSHAVGTAAFPGLVLASGVGFSATLGALGAAIAFTAWMMLLARDRVVGEDAATALALAGCLALGVILASDVFHSGSEIDNLLFGSLLLISGHDLVDAGIAATVVLAASALAGRRWLAVGFDLEAPRGLGAFRSTYDALLLVLIAVATTAALTATGAILVSAIFVVPAATARLFTSRLRTLQAASIALAAAEGVVGLWLSVKTNAPPGATIAVVAGATFGLVALTRVCLTRARGAGAGAVALSAVAATLLLGGCGASGDSGATSGGGAQIKVVATTTQIADFVRQVGGPNVDVDQILQPNTDPHEYEPRPSDVEGAAGAKLAFANGDNLDGWLGKVIDESGGSAQVIDLGTTAPLKLPGEPTGPEASTYDPHWWHDPRNAEAAVRTIATRLESADPTDARPFRTAARAYIGKLQALDAGIAKCMDSVPPGERKLVTDHDAFNYFAKRYGIDVVGAVIPSQTTQAQPSARQVADLVNLIRKEHVKAVFPESSINPKLAQSIAQQTGAKSDYTLYGDTLGPSGSPGATYLQMEQANADAMVRGFTNGAQGCQIAGIG
jgi:ABC-type Zn uptake system ZnuABC Zn-binding protein ZnuA/ABC-type Mn2+/Zn2+ transport system permease subunit